MHAQGVVHRDLKRDNILIRHVDGRPILVDFGIGWLAGSPTVTRDTLPPATYEYRSPEALRFERALAHEGARYRPDEGDDVWALAVTFYWLLTDVLPFGTRREAGLNDRILTLTPRAPREVNPRVPEALSTLCMRMLEKERPARLPGCTEARGVLKAALGEADADWDLPLLDEAAPDKVSTPVEPGKVPRDAEAEEAHQWSVARRRRGEKAARKPAPEAEKHRTPWCRHLPQRPRLLQRPSPHSSRTCRLLKPGPRRPRLPKRPGLPRSRQPRQRAATLRPRPWCPAPRGGASRASCPRVWACCRCAPWWWRP